MTKTHANEPGFVLVPREPTDAMLAAGWDLADFNPLRDGYVGQVYRAMLASAPLVPSPAYGGVREAMEPFAAIGRWLNAEWQDDSTDWPGSVSECENAPPMPTVADLRRARAAYEALSPVAVEEADANLTPCERCQGNGEIVTDWDRYLHSHKGDVGDEAVAECPDCSGQGEVEEADAKADEDAFVRMTEEELLAGIDLPRTPSTPSPQIGKAGAGPVGEAVAWRVRAYPGHRWQIIETIPHNFPRDWEKEPLHVRPSNEPVEAGESAAFDEWWAGSGRKASYASVLYDQAAWVAWKERASRARPVEEPGEVERLTRENNRLTDATIDAEATLAETRERLEKREAALREIASLEEYDVWTANGHAKCNRIARAALSTQESSAALADGKELGR